MHPLLFKIPVFGGIPVHSYGVMVALGMVAGMLFIWYEAKRLGDNPGFALDLVFWVILGGIIGSRIFYIIFFDPQSFTQNPLSLFKIWQGGLVFQGGVAGALVTAYIYIKKHKLSFWHYTDILAPAVALGHAFGRIGCFMAGCCYGREAFGTWCAVTFPQNVSSFAPAGIPLYPTQLMESAGELTIFLLLLFWRKKNKISGGVFAVYLILYGILRMVMENFRGDPREPVFGTGLSIGQFVSIGMMLCGALILFIRSRKKEGAR